MANNTSWAVSLVRGDLLFRLQRKVGLIPEQGLGIVRRALFWSLLAWLPTAVWAWMKGGFLPVEGSEPLLAHFGINARLLLGVPLFIIAEGMMHGTLTALLPRLVSSGVVPPSQLDHLHSVLTGVARLRDSALPWIAIAAVLSSFFLLAAPNELPHELTWAGIQSDGAGLGFGAWWYLYVGRTIFLVLLLAWLWRLALLFVLFKRIAGLELSLVPKLGPIADTAAPYELITKIRPVPLNMGSLAPLVGAAVLPMIVLMALDLPLKTVLKTVLKILV